MIPVRAGIVTENAGWRLQKERVRGYCPGGEEKSSSELILVIVFE